MAMAYIEVFCGNPECRADLGYGAYTPDWKEKVKEEFKKCKYCGEKEIHGCITRG